MAISRFGLENQSRDVKTGADKIVNAHRAAGVDIGGAKFTEDSKKIAAYNQSGGYKGVRPASINSQSSTKSRFASLKNFSMTNLFSRSSKKSFSVGSHSSSSTGSTVSSKYSSHSSGASSATSHTSTSASSSPSLAPRKNLSPSQASPSNVINNKEIKAMRPLPTLNTPIARMQKTQHGLDTGMIDPRQHSGAVGEHSAHYQSLSRKDHRDDAYYRLTGETPPADKTQTSARPPSANIQKQHTTVSSESSFQSRSTQLQSPHAGPANDPLSRALRALDKGNDAPLRSIYNQLSPEHKERADAALNKNKHADQSDEKPVASATTTMKDEIENKAKLDQIKNSGEANFVNRELTPQRAQKKYTHAINFAKDGDTKPLTDLFSNGAYQHLDTEQRKHVTASRVYDQARAGSQKTHNISLMNDLKTSPHYQYFTDNQKKELDKINIKKS